MFLLLGQRLAVDGDFLNTAHGIDELPKVAHHPLHDRNHRDQ